MIDDRPQVSCAFNAAARHTPKSNATSEPTLALDIEKYLALFETSDMSDEEATAVLSALWEIMCRFVELGLGIDASSTACEQASKTARIPDEILLDCTHTQDD